ncbi:MAG: RNA-directed DNA polymerase [Candidatus Competibacteraceae bacterium]|nr:RNA-directed DNA polymerase [Candidatus Competibacteraceae bacterium]
MVNTELFLKPYQSVSLFNIALINLQHSKCASAELNQRGYDCTLITEPYLTGARLVRSIRKGKEKLIYKKGVGARACIKITDKAECWSVSQFLSRDLATISIKLAEVQVYMASAYLDINQNIAGHDIKALAKHCKTQNIPLLIGMDANAHSELWGCESSNARSEQLEEIMDKYGLISVNSGSIPTFVTSRASSIIDVVLINEVAASKFSMRYWKVDLKESFSDHRYVEFGISGYSPKAQFLRNLKHCNWTVFKAAIEDNIGNPDELLTQDDLDHQVECLTGIITDALDKVCLLKPVTNTKPIPWMNKELEHLRDEADKALRKCRCNNYEENLHNTYKEIRSKYRSTLNKAKRDSWRDFCSGLTSAKDIAGVVRNLKAEASEELGLIKNLDGQFVQSPEEVLEIMLKTHFPDSSKRALDFPHIQMCEEEDVEFISEDMVKCYLQSFGSNKAAGPDGLKPVVLQHLGEKAIAYLTNIYKWSVRLGRIPSKWLEMKVIFIPKQGKDDYSSAKSYRPITLSNFMLKGLERLVQWRIQDQIGRGPLFNQHAYTSRFSTESALTEAVDIIEKAIYQDELCLVVSLDCTGAFDYIGFDSARVAMANIGVAHHLTEWYQHLLRFRNVTTTLNGIQDYTIPGRGSPQGGILSLLVWNIIMDTLLRQFRSGGVKAIGYADDVLLLVSGKDSKTIHSLMQDTLNRVISWGDTNGLTFNPSKTSSMLCSLKYKTKHFPLIVKGKVISSVTKLKYLGVLIDPKRTWRPHVKERVTKCKKLFALIKCLIRQKWGLTTRQDPLDLYSLLDPC